MRTLGSRLTAYYSAFPRLPRLARRWNIALPPSACSPLFCLLHRDLADPRAIGAWIKNYERDLTDNYHHDPIIYRQSQAAVSVLHWSRRLT
jgi:hypothetical protein